MSPPAGPPRLPERDLALAWTGVEDWLASNVPAMRSRLRHNTPQELELLDDLQLRRGASLIRAWFAVVGYPETPDVDGLCADLNLLSVRESVRLHAANLANLTSPEGEAESAKRSAGDSAWAWLPDFVPIAREYGSGYYFFVDLRPGDRSGCVKAYDSSEGALGEVVAPDPAHLLRQLKTALDKQGTLAGRRVEDVSESLGWAVVV